MGWASQYVEKLLKGQTVQFRPRGNSMSGKIESGQLVTVVPLHARARNRSKHAPQYRLALLFNIRPPVGLR